LKGDGYTEYLPKRCNNALTLFGITRIPSDNQTRNPLDPVPPSALLPIFAAVCDALHAGGHLQAYRAIERRHGKRRCTDTYRFVSHVPLRDGNDTLQVNWCELTTTDHDGKVVYRNAFATNHAITAANVAEVVRAGRARWKGENENTLKTKGYNLTHNFGHGKQHLSALLASLNLLAFLFHTLLELLDSSYRCLRQFLPRKTFFDDLRALTRYLCFDSWEALMAFMTRGLELQAPDTS